MQIHTNIQEREVLDVGIEVSKDKSSTALNICLVDGSIIRVNLPVKHLKDIARVITRMTK